jgi:hypothetical protein
MGRSSDDLEAGGVFVQIAGNVLVEFGVEAVDVVLLVARGVVVLLGGEHPVHLLCKLHPLLHLPVLLCLACIAITSLLIAVAVERETVVLDLCVASGECLAVSLIPDDVLFLRTVVDY